MEWWQLKKRNADLERELQADLELEEEEQRASGLSPEDAHFAARRAFGNTVVIRERTLEARGWIPVEHILQDLRYALRQFRRSPGFACAVIFTLALGIGANIAVFSVVNTVLLRPLAYPDPDRIVQFFLSSPDGSARGQSIPDLRFLLEHAESVQDISAYDFAQSEMGLTSETPEQVHGIHVTANYFRLFGTPFLLGRAFSETEDSPAGPNVVVLSYSLWKRRFNSDEHIIGKQISIDKEWYTVIGVVGESFHAEPETQLWIPFQFNLNRTDNLHSFGIAARLKPGVSLIQANAQLDSASDAARRDSTFPEPDLHFQLQQFRDAMVGNVRPSLLIMQGAVMLVLLIACANVVNLLLMRTVVRRRELAIRGALGAGRGRIARQLTMESLLLSACGCFLGTSLGILAVHALLAVSPAALPRLHNAGIFALIDWRVIAFAVGAFIATAIVFGVVPALTIRWNGLDRTLRENAERQGASGAGKRSRSIIATSEIALSLVLLIGATLLVRTFLSLNSVDPGFSTRNVLLMTMPLHGDRFHTAAAVTEMVQDAHRRLAAIPGIEESAASFSPPFTSRMGLPFQSLADHSKLTGDAQWLAASPGYLQVLGIPLLRGTRFDQHSTAGAPGVVLINEAMAKQYWPGRDPIGQQILLGEGLGPKFSDRPRTIIGIIGDTHDQDLSQAAEPVMIIPEAQQPDGLVQLETGFGPLWWLVRTQLPQASLIPAITEQLREASGGRPVGPTQTMDDLLAGSIATQRFNMLLLSSFASIALLLALIGIYGVIAYSVAQRTHEIGVRMALGADRSRVRNLVLREGMLTGIVGILTGLGGAFFLVRLLTELLFGVTTRDPIVFIAAPLVLLSTILLATWIPARRAASVDPMQALRNE